MMIRTRWYAGAAADLLAGSVLVFADDEAKSAKPKAHAVRLTKPWSELSGLTDDQKKQILEIHGKANEEIAAIKEKEHTDIVALLTDDQKKEVTTLEEAEKKKGHASKEKEEAPTTKPVAKE